LRALGLRGGRMAAQVQVSGELLAAKVSRPRASVGLLVAFALFLAVLALPMPSLTPQAHRLAGIFAAVITLWVTEAIPLPITALLGPAAAVMLGVTGIREAFAPFSEPILFLFIGSFILAQGMIRHGLSERLACSILSWPAIGFRPTRVLAAYGGTAFLLSMFLSNTAVAAMLLPIGISLLAMMEAERAVSSSYGIALMLMTTYAASFGGMSTPVGTPANLITSGMIQRFLGVRITFVEWMLIAIPPALVMLVIGMLYLRFVSQSARGEVLPRWKTLRPSSRKVEGWTAAERNVVIAFVFTVTLWIVPGLLQLFLGPGHLVVTWFGRVFPESSVALLGAFLLFVLPVSPSQRATLSWGDAAQIDWGTILLLGGGLSLGNMAFSTKLAEVLGGTLAAGLPATSLLSVTWAATILGTLTAEIMSHTAASNIVIPIVIAIAQAVGVDPLAPAIAACLGTSIGLMLPVSTPPNAIVFASGRLPIRTMIRHGIMIDLFGLLLIPPMVLVLVKLVR
jgi:sodium-dependent dicarboxylate transporter 2/3/5